MRGRAAYSTSAGCVTTSNSSVGMCRAKPQKHLDIQDVDTSAVKGRAAHVQQVSDVLAGFTFVDQFAGLLDPLGLQFRVPTKLQPASLRRLDLEDHKPSNEVSSLAQGQNMARSSCRVANLALDGTLGAFPDSDDWSYDGRVCCPGCPSG